MDFIENQTRVNFPGNRMAAAATRTDPEKIGSKKKNNFFGFS